MINQAAIDQYLDDHHDRFKALGACFFEVFDSVPQSRISAQVRNLQQIVLSAQRFSDIEAFVKNQMGKNSQSSRAWCKVGDRVLEDLRLLQEAAKQSQGTDSAAQLQVRLKLARGWVRAVVSEYLYHRAKREMEISHVQP